MRKQPPLVAARGQCVVVIGDFCLQGAALQQPEDVLCQLRLPIQELTDLCQDDSRLACLYLCKLALHIVKERSWGLRLQGHRPHAFLRRHGCDVGHCRQRGVGHCRQCGGALPPTSGSDRAASRTEMPTCKSCMLAAACIDGWLLGVG